MCQLGDIILVQKYKDSGNLLNRHSFVVIDDENDQINGVSYDMICNVMSSFKNKAQRKRKMSYPGNFPIVFDDRIVENDNEREGYIKADQLYYFQKDSLDYEVIGQIKPEVFNLLMEFIEESDFELIDITDNLK